MRIGIIGGVEHAEVQFAARAAQEGHEVSFHRGHLGGRGSRNLVDVVTHVDVVIIVTDTNSHGAVQLARRTLRRLGRTPLLMRRCGLAKFSALLRGLAPPVRASCAPA